MKLIHLFEDAGLQFDEVYNKYYDVVRRVAYGMLKDPNEAEDVAQIVFAKIARHLNNIQPKAIVGYLRTATKNTCLNVLRQRKRHPQSVMDLDTQPTKHITDIARDSIDKALRSAPKSSKIALELHLQGYSLKEIAQHLGVSYERANNILGDARKALRSGYLS